MPRANKLDPFHELEGSFSKLGLCSTGAFDICILSLRGYVSFCGIPLYNRRRHGEEVSLSRDVE